MRKGKFFKDPFLKIIKNRKEISDIQKKLKERENSFHLKNKKIENLEEELRKKKLFFINFLEKKANGINLLGLPGQLKNGFNNGSPYGVYYFYLIKNNGVSIDEVQASLILSREEKKSIADIVNTLQHFQSVLDGLNPNTKNASQVPNPEAFDLKDPTFEVNLRINLKEENYFSSKPSGMNERETFIWMSIFDYKRQSTNEKEITSLLEESNKKDTWTNNFQTVQLKIETKYPDFKKLMLPYALSFINENILKPCGLGPEDMDLWKRYKNTVQTFILLQNQEKIPVYEKPVSIFSPESSNDSLIQRANQNDGEAELIKSAPFFYVDLDLKEDAYSQIFWRLLQKAAKENRLLPEGGGELFERLHEFSFVIYNEYKKIKQKKHPEDKNFSLQKERKRKKFQEIVKRKNIFLAQLFEQLCTRSQTNQKDPHTRSAHDIFRRFCYPSKPITLGKESERFNVFHDSIYQRLRRLANINALNLDDEKDKEHLNYIKKKFSQEIYSDLIEKNFFFLLSTQNRNEHSLLEEKSHHKTITNYFLNIVGLTFFPKYGIPISREICDYFRDSSYQRLAQLANTGAIDLDDKKDKKDLEAVKEQFEAKVWVDLLKKNGLNRMRNGSKNSAKHQKIFVNKEIFLKILKNQPLFFKDFSETKKKECEKVESPPLPSDLSLAAPQSIDEIPLKKISHFTEKKNIPLPLRQESPSFNRFSKEEMYNLTKKCEHNNISFLDLIKLFLEKPIKSPILKTQFNFLKNKLLYAQKSR